MHVNVSKSVRMYVCYWRKFCASDKHTCYMYVCMVCMYFCVYKPSVYVYMGVCM